MNRFSAEFFYRKAEEYYEEDDFEHAMVSVEDAIELLNCEGEFRGEFYLKAAQICQKLYNCSIYDYKKCSIDITPQLIIQGYFQKAVDYANQAYNYSLNNQSLRIKSLENLSSLFNQQLGMMESLGANHELLIYCEKWMNVVRELKDLKPEEEWYTYSYKRAKECLKVIKKKGFE